MGYNNRNFIDEMVDVFGYDYVIGFCLCSEYDLNNKARKEADETRAENFSKAAKKYGLKAEQLSRERIANGL